MSNVGIIEFGTLNWVKREIDHTLDCAREAIEGFSSQSGDTTPLRLFVNHLHQVVGTLQMVELDGAAMLVSEAELLASTLINDDGRSAAEPAETIIPLLDSSLRYLSTYLQRLQQGKTDALVSNLQHINELRRARGQHPLDVFSIFDPNLDVYPARPPGHEHIDEDGYKEKVRDIRREFQKSLLKWLQSSDIEALHVITALTRELQDIARFNSVVQLWWVASAYSEMMALSPEDEGVAHKHVPARLDQLLRKLIDQGEAALVKEREDTLLREMLYDIGSSSCNSKLLTEIRHAFNLNEILRGEVDGTEQKFASVPVDLEEKLEGEIRSIKQEVVDYFGSSARDEDKRQLIKDKLGRSAEQLQQYGLNDLVGLIRETVSVMDLAGAEDFSTDGHQAAAFQVAEALLFLEETLKRRDKLDQDWLDTLNEKFERMRMLSKIEGHEGDPKRLSVARPTDSEVKRLLPRVAGEMYICLNAAEEALEAFAREPDQPRNLESAREKLSHVQGVLQMLGQYKAADMLSTTKDYIEKLERGDIESSDRLIDSLAVAVGTAERFVDGLEHGRPHVHEMVDRAIQELEDVLTAHELVEFDPGKTIGALRQNLDDWLNDTSDHRAFSHLRGGLREVSAAATVKNQPRLRRIAQEMNNLFDIVTEDPAFLSPEIESTLRRSLATLAGMAPGLVGDQSSAEVGPVRGPAVESDMDFDIRELFREEAKECISIIEELIRKWHGGDADDQLFADLRRQFHTLKGSGRTAGATPVAELSWIAESLLNDVLDRGMEVSDEVMAFADDAGAAVSRGTEDEEFGADVIDLEQWAARADGIRTARTDSVEHPVSSEHPGPEQNAVAERRQIVGLADDEAPGESPAPALDDTVIRIFTQETLNHLGTIRNFLGAATTAVSPELLLAVHTLGGTSRSLHLVEMSNLFHALDEHLNRIRQKGEALVEVECRILDKAAILSAQVLDRLNTDRTFPASVRTEFDGLHEELARVREFSDFASTRGEKRSISGISLLGELMSQEKTRGLDGADVTAPFRTSAAGDEVDDLRSVFLEESTDILSRINKSLDEWRGSADLNGSLGNIKRDLHTLKGGAYAAGFEAMGDLSHQTETMLQRQENGLAISGEELRSLLEETHDSLVEMVIQIGRGASITDTAYLSARLSGLIGRGPGERDDAGHAIEDTEKIVEDVVSASTADLHDSATESMVTESGSVVEPESFRSGHEVLRIDSAMLDKLVNYAGELSITRAQMQEHLGTLRSNLGELRDNVARFSEQLRRLDLQADSQIRSRLNDTFKHPEDDGARGSEFDPLQMDRYTELQQLSRGLSESLDDLTTIQTGITRFVHDSESVLQQQAKLGFELQDGLMSTRLVPFSTILPRLRHQARQVARELEKDIELRMDGGEVEIDRKVLDGISEALDHMIRNAVDHGIENPQDRERQEKRRAGTILIDCKQRGNEVVVRFGDDGRGLDAENIRKKAVEQGLIESGDPISDQQLIQFIVLPGFTTATEVTQLSGRGVGLDVVHDAVRRLGGSIIAESQPGRGTAFEISLPVSLSITQAVFVRCGRQEFAIPLNIVQSVIKADTGEMLPSAHGRPRFEKDGHAYPLLDLPRHLDLAHGREEKQRAAILIVRMGAREVAVKVSELMGSQEVVVKSLGRHISPVEWIAGATIRGDGSVIIILDLAGLWIADERHSSMESTVQDVSEQPPLVMVVDDSLTVRKVTARNLSRHGMEVVMAKDGIDALGEIGKRQPDLMLVDIEMPRMDGYELTAQVRNDPLTRNIPIVIITSRAGIKHQEKAMSLGANDYLTKPYQEEELIAHVEKCLASSGFPSQGTQPLPPSP